MENNSFKLLIDYMHGLGYSSGAAGHFVDMIRHQIPQFNHRTKIMTLPALQWEFVIADYDAEYHEVHYPVKFDRRLKNATARRWRILGEIFGRKDWTAKGYEIIEARVGRGVEKIYRVKVREYGMIGTREAVYREGVATKVFSRHQPDRVPMFLGYSGLHDILYIYMFNAYDVIDMNGVFGIGSR